MQEIRRFKPSTVSRRFSVTAGFYRTCVIDGLLEHSPAEHLLYRFRTRRRVCDLRFGWMGLLRQDRGSWLFVCST
jgi:hypothetical protein